jgi:hypothetical protein
MGYRQDAVTKVKVCSPANHPCYFPMVEIAPRTNEKTKYWLKKGYMLEETCNKTIDVQQDR